MITKTREVVKKTERTLSALRIVDLAGSERNYETVKHTKEQAGRGGAINGALQNLKECVRLRWRNLNDDEQNYIPYR